MKPQAHSSYRVRAGWLFLLIAAFGLQACQTGDFGRRKTSFLYEASTDLIAPIAGQERGEPYSHYRMTDHEKRMRSMAYRFGMPPRLRFEMERIVWDLQYKRLLPSHFPPMQPSDYHAALRSTNPQSHETYFRMITADILADIELLHALQGAILQVYSDDNLRLGAAVRLLPGEAVPGSPALERMAENRQVVDTVRIKLRERYRLYDYSYRHYMIEVPSIVGNETETALERFQIAITRFDHDLARSTPGFWDKGRMPSVITAK